MIDKLIRLLPDVFNPLEGLWARIRHGRMHRFTWVGATGIRAEQALERYGIPVWGREMHPSGERGFLVKQAQAAWAERQLCMAGIQLTCPLINPRNSNFVGSGKRDESWGVGVRSRTAIMRAVDMLGGGNLFTKQTKSGRRRTKRRRNG